MLRALRNSLLGGLGLLALALPQDAHAGRPALDPQIRMHVGPSMMPGPSGIGGIVGFDSRLTRVVYMDLGGMFSPMPIAADYAVPEDTDSRDHFRLRHAIYVAPGLRIPHRQPINFHWDVMWRFGAAMLWSTDVSESQTFYASGPTGRRMEFDAGGLTGLDVQVMQAPKGNGSRVGRFGARASGRVVLYNTFYEDRLNDIFTWTPQYSVEAIYEF